MSSYQLAADKYAAVAIVSVIAVGCTKNVSLLYEANWAKLPAWHVLRGAGILSPLRDTTFVEQVNTVLTAKKKQGGQFPNPLVYECYKSDISRPLILSYIKTPQELHPGNYSSSCWCINRHVYENRVAWICLSLFGWWSANFILKLKGLFCLVHKGTEWTQWS